MLTLFIYCLSLQYGTKATTVPLPIQQELPSATSSTNLSRTLFTIIWSCVSTTIICSWVSVHPNVPPRRKSSAFLRRISMMFWTIIAPELVLAWAVRQRSAAKMVQKEFKDRQWTEAHGHFLIMGGFTLINGKIDKEPKEPEKPHWFPRNHEREADYARNRRHYDKEYRRYNLGPVSFEDFKKLVDDADIDFPTITTADINDRSKGDVLSKSLAVIQTTWFLFQCVARIPQRLAVTQLELVTLALASLNAVTFFFWWHKPLQVQEPVKLFLKTTRVQEDLVLEDRERGPQWLRHKKAEMVRQTVSTIREIIIQVGSLFRGFIRNPCEHGPLLAIVVIFFIPICLICFAALPIFLIAIVTLWSIPSIDDTSNKSLPINRIGAQTLDHVLELTISIRDFFQGRFHEWHGVGEAFIKLLILFPLIFVILLFLFLFLILVFLFIPFLFNFIFNIATTDKIPAGARHVPSFYAPRTTSDRYSRIFVVAFFGAMFGGLHVIGWSFEFATPLERTLWQVTAVAITGIPLVVSLLDFLIAQDFSSFWLANIFLALPMAILLCIYVPARLSLIAQAIALLRHQPPSAFAFVKWAKFIPHILSS